jgi:hypothetical protein
MRYLALLILAASCGTDNDEHKAQTKQPLQDLTAQLEQRYEEYKGLTPNKGEWAYTTCDGLLFSSLHAVAVNQQFPIEQAEVQPGKWLRRPPAYGTCSDGEISRDMILGLMVYAAHFKRVDVLQRLYDYAIANDLKMGEGDDRTVLSPQLLQITARLIKHLGGQDNEALYLPEIYFYSTTPGYQSHLTLLSIHLHAIIYRGLGDTQLTALRNIIEHSPANPLAQALLSRYTNGDLSTTKRLLLETWPAGRLPTGADWCEEWRTQRADGDRNFTPCNVPKHTGGDFLFTAALVLGKL